MFREVKRSKLTEYNIYFENMITLLLEIDKTLKEMKEQERQYWETWKINKVKELAK